ncbi:MAG TPA: glycosyltransferase family 1 protein [Tepidisphaeraceae bacterium]|nr:glycosyltransferase family 1 protein [Tepidisphaeraceae bacterium]
MPPPPLHVAIDGRLFGGKSGGIEQVVIGLVDALSHLTDGHERYTILAYPKSHDWLAPYVRGPCRMLLATAVRGRPSTQGQSVRALPGAPPRIPPFRREPTLSLRARRRANLSTSDGTLERLNVDVVHFVLQRAFFTEVPSIYHPHDLLHRHLPHLLTRRERAKRDVMLGSFCHQARVVSVTSSWVKRDLTAQFGTPPEKIAVVPLTGSLGAYQPPTDAELAATRAKFALPDAFAFYPAQTWPHKNHLALLDAIAHLRDHHNLRVPLICSGHQNHFYPTIQKRIADLNLTDQVHFPGFITPNELRALYQLCRCVVIPTLFEAASGPLNEAFMAGAPAACSNVTSLPEQAADAALVFDPRDPAAIATAIARLWTDPTLRRTLADKGRARVARWTWARAARHFRALYRQIGGRALTAEDRAMLGATPDI